MQMTTEYITVSPSIPRLICEMLSQHRLGLAGKPFYPLLRRCYEEEETG